MPNLKELEGYFAKTVKRRDEAVAKFAKDLAENPFHTIVWAQGTMQDVARASVAEHYLRSIQQWREAYEGKMLTASQPQDEDAAVEFIKSSVFRQCVQRCGYVERSTSMTSNFMKAEENAFYAYLANEWEMLYG